MWTTLKNLWLVGVYIFALIGFVMVAVYFAVASGLTDTKGIIDMQQWYFQNQGAAVGSSVTPAWAHGEEWETLKAGIARDTAVIAQVANSAGVSPRRIISVLIVEQLRLFHTERAIFKQIFAPLQILGNQSQFSWGVMGVKPETAMQTEVNLKDSISPFYLGSTYEHLLDFTAETTEDINQERFERITNEDSRYWSYLYGALILKQIDAQWDAANFPISDRPEISATLYNIGFNNSHPKAEPLVGGAAIEINGVTYSFGGLAGEFYYSNELIDSFPRK